MVNPRWTFDRKAAYKNVAGIVGVDEAGRGCLAGPVIAGAILLPKTFFRKAKNRIATSEMNDSKQFNELKREFLFQRILELGEKEELIWSAGSASVEEIESKNVVGATALAMKRAMDRVSQKSAGLWKPAIRSERDLFHRSEESFQDVSWIVRVDGPALKKLPYVHEGLIKGDGLSVAVAMASLVAKVCRDQKMKRLHEEFPLYDFSSNKGYGSPKHLQALRSHGPTVHHRARFLRKVWEQNQNHRQKKKDPQSKLSLD